MGDTLPVWSCLCTQRITLETPTLNTSDALCRLRPLATAETARMRRSSEYGLLILAGLRPASILNHKSIPRGIPSDSLDVDNALGTLASPRRPWSAACDRNSPS